MARHATTHERPRTHLQCSDGEQLVRAVEVKPLRAMRARQRRHARAGYACAARQGCKGIQGCDGKQWVGGGWWGSGDGVGAREHLQQRRVHVDAPGGHWLGTGTAGHEAH